MAVCDASEMTMNDGVDTCKTNNSYTIFGELAGLKTEIDLRLCVSVRHTSAALTFSRRMLEEDARIRSSRKPYSGQCRLTDSKSWIILKQHVTMARNKLPTEFRCGYYALSIVVRQFRRTRKTARTMTSGT